MNVLNGWKTYIVAAAAILAGALEAIPKELTGNDVGAILGLVMLLLRSISTGPAVISFNKSFAIPLVLIGLGSGIVACKDLKPPTAAQCAALLVAADNATLGAKCDQAPDPTKDASCITIATLRSAYALCLTQVPPPPEPTPVP